MNTRSTDTAWELLGSVRPRALVEARLQLHHVLQVPQSYSRSLLLPRDDDSQANLGWSAPHAALVTHPVEDKRVGLCFRDSTLLFLDGEREVSRFELPGHTLDDAVEWLRSHMGRNVAAHLRDTPFGIPKHPVEDDEPLDLEVADAAELGLWFANAWLVLDEAARGAPDAGLVRCWPHHFDLATLIVLAGDGGEESRTVGAGLSPGDTSYTEPYFYVAPWPYPEADDLPPAPGDGHWHTKDFTAAVLPSSQIVSLGDAAAQAAGVREFLGDAIEACRSLAARAEA